PACAFGATGPPGGPCGVGGVNGPAGTNCAEVMVVLGSASAASLSHAVDTEGVDAAACALSSMTVMRLNMRRSVVYASMSIYSCRLPGALLTSGLMLVCCMAVRAQTPAGGREGLADLPGVHLWFNDSGGSGEPVVFVHAATGSSRVWEYQRPVFASRGYRVITYDRRGYGRSVTDSSGPQPGTGADDLNALMDYLKVE